MSDTYELDIRARTSNRELILLGVRADADIDYKDKRIAELEKTITTISGGVSTSRIAELEAENKALRDRLKDAYRWNAITGDYRRVLQEQGK